jgi:tRNA-intron endonuclease
MVENLPKAHFYGKRIIIEDESQASKIHQFGSTGKPLSGGRLQISPVESLYLLEKEKIEVFHEKENKEIDFNELSSVLVEENPDLLLKYRVYRDLRSRGLVVKTGLKYGAHFRVYSRGEGPGSSHSPYLVHAVSEDSKLTPQDLAGSVRLAHSVRKDMIYGIVDDEGDITYYSIKRETL